MNNKVNSEPGALDILQDLSKKLLSTVDDLKSTLETIQNTSDDRAMRILAESSIVIANNVLGSALTYDVLCLLFKSGEGENGE